MRTFTVTVVSPSGFAETIRIKGASHFLSGGELWVYDERSNRIATINNVKRVVSDESEPTRKKPTMLFKVSDGDEFWVGLALGLIVATAAMATAMEIFL